MICQNCGARAESDLCFRCKPRKPFLKISNKFRGSGSLKDYYTTPNGEGVKSNFQMQHFFISIWKDRDHRSEVSKTSLGSEALSVFFHHIIPKEKYPEAKFDPENIVLLTLDEHSSVELDMYKYEEVNKRRESLHIKYKIFV